MVNPQLLDYIKKQLAQGLSKETIQQNLISAGGWNLSDITEVFSTLGVNQGVPVSSNVIPGVKKSHILSISITVVVILLVLIGGVVYYQKTRIILSNQLEKSYSNDAGYSVMYPGQSILTEAPSDPDHIFVSSSPTFQFHLYDIGIYSNATASFTIDSIGETCPGYLGGFQNSKASTSTISGKTVYFNPNPGQPSFNQGLGPTRNYLIYRSNSSCYLITTLVDNTPDSSQFTTWFENNVLNNFTLTDISPTIISTFGQSPSTQTNSIASTTSSVSSSPSGNTPGTLSNSDISAITTTVNAFKQAFLNADQQGVLEYSSAATQGTLKISQLNTSFKEITIKQITFCNSSCRPSYYTNNNEVSVVLNTISSSGVSGNMRWGFVEENGVWKFDLGLTMKLAHSI